MRLTLLLLITSLITSIALSTPATQKLRVSNIKNSRIADGCGCYFQFPGTNPQAQKYLFFSSVEEEEREAWMNIAGKDVKLTLVSKTDPKGRERVGSRSTRRYATQGIVLDATYLATRVCGVNEESCEATDYDATFKLTMQGQQRIIKAKGVCGC